MNQTYVHIFDNGTRSVLTVKTRKKHEYYEWTWYPQPASLEDLDDLEDEWEMWRCHWATRFFFDAQDDAGYRFGMSAKMHWEHLKFVLAQ